jgi:KDO2-lipid IV(A) lauroyltransferase
LIILLSPVFYKRFKVGFNNLSRCFPQQSILWILKKLLCHLYYFIRSFCDRIWIWHGNQAWVKRSVLIDEHSLKIWYEYEQSILLAPHFLGLDAASSRLCMERRPMAALYSKQKKFDNWFYQGRIKYNDNVVLLERSGNISALK